MGKFKKRSRFKKTGKTLLNDIKHKARVLGVKEHDLAKEQERLLDQDYVFVKLGKTEGLTAFSKKNLGSKN